MWLISGTSSLTCVKFIYLEIYIYTHTHTHFWCFSQHPMLIFVGRRTLGTACDDIIFSLFWVSSLWKLKSVMCSVWAFFVFYCMLD